MGRPTIYQLTAERKRLLREHYGRLSAPELLRLEAFQPLPQEPPLHPWTIYDWAKHLGLTNSLRGKWTDEHEALLEDHWRAWPLKKLTALLGHSARAIEERAHTLNLENGYYSARDIGAMLGVHHTRVLGWEREGWLHAGAGTHRYTPFDLGKFLWKHPAEAYTGAMTFEIFLSMVSHMAIASRPVERRSPQPKGKVG